MSDFFKKFLAEDPRRLSPSGRFVGLAAFGKHPGWDDHVENLGLKTESLNFARMVLYVDGIGGQIDSGAWEKLEPGQQLPDFNHIFVWQRSGQILVGRLWSSSDGKGRKRYPMVVCLHFTGVTLGWALKQGLPALAELQEDCVKTTSAEDVRGLLNRKRAALREAVQSADDRGEYAPVTPATLHNILQPAGDAEPEGFFRVLYQIQSQFGAFAPGKFNGRANSAALRAQQIRVPASGESPEQALLFWSRFFLAHVDASVPLLLALPLEAGWVDITAGEPESQEFFCLRASPKAVPTVSDVPYKLDDAFRAKAAAFLDGFQQGETAAADLEPASDAASVGDALAQAKGGWRKWLGVGALIIICAVAAIVFLPKVGEQQATRDASDASAKVTNPVSPAEIAGPAAVDAANLKAEVETPAKEKERQTGEAIRLAKEKEAIMQNDLQEQKYQTAMKDGQAALDRKDYAQAITQAGVALDTKANDSAATKLRTDAQRQLDLVNNAKAQEQKYQTAMKDGQAALDRKDYAQAITQAGVALDTRANDPAATKLRTDAQRQLDLVSNAKAQEQKYQTAMKDGQTALDRKDYAQAITQAGVALDTKANDPAATKLRTDAQRQLDLVSNAKAQEQKYQTAVKEGQTALDRKDYAQAITQAGVALDTKANDPAATKLRTDAQRQLDLVSNAKAQEQKYQTAVKEGQAALDRKDYAQAITQAGVALDTKANDPAATKLRTDAQRQLDLVSNAKGQEQKYQTAMKDGQTAFDRKDYAEAITQAGVALDTKANDPAATKLRTDAQRQLDLVNNAKAQEQKYQTAMKEGQAAFDRKDYAEAITQAGMALDTKANDPAATKLRTKAQEQLDLVNTAKKIADEQTKANKELAAAAAAKASNPEPAAGSPSSAPPARGEITNSIGMVLVQVSSEISVGKYEVTQAEYRKVMGKNPSKSVNVRQPVEQVAWNDAKVFCRKLTEMERGKLPDGKVYTLPTEKQWTEFLGGQRFEDLPRGGVTGKGEPSVVGESGPANKFGLFDVLGNVWEWCLDDADRGQKVLKGGAFNSTKPHATLLPDRQVSNCGFRCVLAAQ